jgi:hypothetical protein
MTLTDNAECNYTSHRMPVYPSSGIVKQLIAITTETQHKRVKQSHNTCMEEHRGEEV